MISFKEYVKRVDEAKEPALHLMPTAGYKATKFKGKPDFDAHISANAGRTQKKKGDNGKTYHVKNGKVHGVWDSVEKIGVAYTSSKNESEELDESTVDHTLGHKIAKNLGTKLKSFAHGRYKRNNSVIPGNIEYTFHDDKATHKDVHAALVKSGFKAPQHDDIMHDRESMKSWTNSAVSSTHTAHTSQEHGGPLKLHIQARNVSESVELDESSSDNLPIDSVHKHIQRFMGMGTSLKLADHMRTGTATHTSWEKVNSDLTAIGVKPQHIATLAVKIRPAQYDEQEELDEAEGLTTKKNQNGGHDVYHNGTHIGHVEQKSMPWLRGKTIKKVFAKKPNGDSVVVDSDDSGKNTIESAKKTLLKHHLCESVELDEATFTSDSPSTGGSRGVNFEVKKNKEKSVGTHVNGQPVEHHDVYHDGKHVGSVSSYSGYKDKKAPGARIVTSRKDVKAWSVHIHAGEHAFAGGRWGTTPENSHHYETRFNSKKDALQYFANNHKSNSNR